MAELTESFQKLNKQTFKTIIKTIESVITNLQSINPPQQRVETSTISEGGQATQRVSQWAPPITTTTKQTAPATMKTKPRTHLRKTRNNTPDTAPSIMTTHGKNPKTQRKSKRLNPNIVEPVILATSPNSNRIPMTHAHSSKKETLITPEWDTIIMTPVGLVLPAHRQAKNTHPHIIDPDILASPNFLKRIPMARYHIISQEVINLVTNTVYGDTRKRWIPDNFITASPTTKPTNAYDIEVEHYCAPVVHPVTGVTINQYRKLANDPVKSDIWKEHAFGK